MPRKRKEKTIVDARAETRTRFQELFCRGDPLAVTWVIVFAVYADVPCPCDRTFHFKPT
jgi:hypothetical protein